MRNALFLTLICASAGCAAQTPTFSERLGASEAMIRAAEEVGADEDPRADAHLRLAREQVARATRLSSEGVPDRARRMLLRAQADVELAIALAREARAQARTHETLEGVGAIHRQLR
ncbi:DUF4398 domain-containing protein [Sorangium sp. So ce1000]|uniref:DUF4398 domain-containing protein n=1 Tax=Sorangium sp. So ce1000 TaxID=3133325 RepID=UPI003F610014